MKTYIIDLCTDTEEITNSIDFNSFKCGEHEHEITESFKVKKISSLKTGYWLVETNIEKKIDMLHILYKFKTEEYAGTFIGYLLSINYFLNSDEEEYKDIKKYVKRLVMINNILNEK